MIIHVISQGQWSGVFALNNAMRFFNAGLDLFPSGAMASTEVRQKLHDFLLNKSAKDTPPPGHPLNQRAKLWYMYVKLHSSYVKVRVRNLFIRTFDSGFLVYGLLF